jgi:TonB family protein
MKAKVQGTVVLKVVIGADGRAQKISVQQALPCGLDQQSINAVNDRKFRPATGPTAIQRPWCKLSRLPFTYTRAS